jgi:hypothetical protein
VLNPLADRPDPHWDAILEYLTNHYGESPLGWGEVVMYRLRPQWMAVYAPQSQELLSGS